MSEPMSAEVNPQSEQLKRQSEQIVSDLRKQNDALGRSAMQFIPKENGSEFILFRANVDYQSGKSVSYSGGFDNGAVLVDDRLAHSLRVGGNHGQKFEEIVNQGEYASKVLKMIKIVQDDESFDQWKRSLAASEKIAVDGIKKERANEHYTPKALAVVGDMPNIIGAAGFDMHAEMRRVQATPKVTPTGAEVYDGNVDNVRIGASGADTTYDFEPDAAIAADIATLTPTEIPTRTATPTPTGTNTPEQPSS